MPPVWHAESMAAMSAILRAFSCTEPDLVMIDRCSWLLNEAAPLLISLFLGLSSCRISRILSLYWFNSSTSVNLNFYGRGGQGLDRPDFSLRPWATAKGKIWWQPQYSESQKQSFNQMWYFFYPIMSEILIFHISPIGIYLYKSFSRYFLSKKHGQ